MTEQGKIAALAAAFVNVVWEWTTPDELAEIKRRNATPDYSTCCATHDFFDANMAMERAFRETFGRSPIPDEGEMSAEDTDAWDAAWDIAKRELSDPCVS